MERKYCTVLYAIGDFIVVIARPLSALLLILICACWVLSPAWAAKRAFVVGINSYDKVPKLSRALNDSRAVAAALKDLGFEVTGLEDAGKAAFQKAWGGFLNDLQEGDTAFVYFAGHGIQLQGLNILLLKDTPDASRGEEAVRSHNAGFHELVDQLEARKPKLSFYVLDACRDNPFGGKGKAIGSPRGLARLESVFGSFVMYSAGPDEQALDELSLNDKDPNSVYTRRLLPLLRDRELSLVDVAKRIQVQVEEDARTKGGHQQRPAYFDGVLGHYNIATDAHGTDSLLFTTQEEWIRHPRVMRIDARAQYDIDCNSVTPPKITVVTPPKFGRIVTRYASFTASRPAALDSKPNRCFNTQQRGLGIYYVMDEEHRDKKAVDSARIRIYHFLTRNKPTLTVDYAIDPATRSRKMSIVK
jgi:hypothetical protein